MSWSLHGASGRELEVDRCLVMGILNATPDSFSDGGRPIDDGRIGGLLDADIIDVGGESTRPGHTPVPGAEERARVVPAIEAVRAADEEIWISIDTRKASVAAAALDAGADFVNDVSGLVDPGMARVVRDAGCSVVLMRHQDLQGDVVRACRDELQSLLVRARSAGISDAQVILDPGLGFGKRPGGDVEDNMRLIDGLASYALGLPVLIGHSRKRFVGAWTGIEDPERRDEASAQVSRRAADAGAALLRVHDVGTTLRALGR